MARQLVEGDAVARDVDPEILATLELTVHFVERMDDDVYRPRDGGIASDPVFVDIPVIGNVGQVLMADHDQQIEVGLIVVLRLVHPVVARIAAEPVGLVDLASPVVRRSDERRGGKEWSCTCRNRGTRY